MLKPVVFALAVSFSVSAFCQPVQPEWSKAEKAKEAAEASRPQSVCDLMSPEEMHECLVTKPHKGGRSVYCDKVSRSEIESCLQQKDSAGGASAHAKDTGSARAGAK